MSKFMINIFYGNGKPSLEGEALMQKYREWSQEIGAKIASAHKLRDGQGRRLELSGGKVNDGPYIETKESIGGFYIVEAKSYGEAMSLAAGCPTLLYGGGFVEVREVEF